MVDEVLCVVDDVLVTEVFELVTDVVVGLVVVFDIVDVLVAEEDEIVNVVVVELVLVRVLELVVYEVLVVVPVLDDVVV